MRLFTENTVDAAREKHVPVIAKTADGWKVTVGSVAHPMEEKHFIEWIALYAGDRVLRKYLKPGDAPEAEFQCPETQITAKEYCNLHGLWSAKN
jgi:superoxide reductase